jgi:23S rRNA-/tRNA-specific pseudouridylate synthase
MALHDLDSAASGVCLFARSKQHARSLHEALAAGEQRYVALVRGKSRDKGSVNRTLKEGSRAVEARTRYVRRALVAGHSLLEVRPDRNRSDQIGKHLASLGHPLLGDSRHGDKSSNSFFWHRHGLERSFLHLESVELELGGHQVVVRSELAPDLAAVLESMKRAGDGMPPAFGD